MAGYRVWGLALGIVAMCAVSSMADARTSPDVPPRTVKVLRVSGTGLDAGTVQSLTDTVLAKLAWYRLGGEVSDRQWRDVVSVLHVQADRLDHVYLRTWAKTLAVSDLLARALEQTA